MNAPLAIIDKRRPKANVSEVMNIIGDVKGKRAVIVDDLVDTAGTLCNGAKAIIEVGGATEVYACATHGVLSGPAIERIEQSVIKELVLLDTIALPEEKKSPKSPWFRWARCLLKPSSAFMRTNRFPRCSSNRTGT